MRGTASAACVIVCFFGSKMSIRVHLANLRVSHSTSSRAHALTPMDRVCINIITRQKERIFCEIRDVAK